MKTKDKKAKAQEFINKYQLGGDFNNYEMQNPYQYDSSLMAAQQNQLVTPPLNQLNSAKSQSAYQPQSSFLDSAIPFISPAINLGIGVANIFSSIKEKSRQKNYERAFQKDLERRKTESRFNDFYATPYSVGSGSVRSGAPGYQTGGQVNQMNQMDLFLDLYNQQETQKQNLDNQFQDYYQQKNNQMKQSWKSKQSSGLNSLMNGVIGAIPLLQEGGQVDTIDSLRKELQQKLRDIDIKKATSLQKLAGRDTLKNYNKIVNGADSEDLKIGFKSNKFSDRFREHQDGGEILNPVIDPTQDLYSPEYKVPPEVEDEVSQVQIEAKEDDTMMNWLFEDLPEEPDEVNQTYFAEEESIPDTRYTGDVSNMGKSIAVSMNNPGNIKMGKFAARYGATPGRQATDGGVFAKFPDVETGLKAQRDLLLSSGYANLTVGEAMKRWSNNGYGADLYPEVANKPLYLLSDRELIELQRRQIQREDPTMYKILYKQ